MSTVLGFRSEYILLAMEGGRAGQEDRTAPRRDRRHFPCCLTFAPRRTTNAMTPWPNTVWAVLFAQQASTTQSRLLRSGPIPRAAEKLATALEFRIRPCKHFRVCLFTLNTAACSRGCSARATYCPTLRGELGAVGPPRVNLGCSMFSPSKQLNMCSPMTNDEDRWPMADGN